MSVKSQKELRVKIPDNIHNRLEERKEKTGIPIASQVRQAVVKRLEGLE